MEIKYSYMQVVYLYLTFGVILSSTNPSPLENNDVNFDRNEVRMYNFYEYVGREFKSMIITH